MIRRPPRSTLDRSSAASDVYKRQQQHYANRLVVAVGYLCPASGHGESGGMRGGTDAAVWTVARDRGVAILTKDEDFSGMSVLYVAPPKVMHLRMADGGT